MMSKASEDQQQQQQQHSNTSFDSSRSSNRPQSSHRDVLQKLKQRERKLVGVI